jgi:hypothetical protein
MFTAENNRVEDGKEIDYEEMSNEHDMTDEGIASTQRHPDGQSSISEVKLHFGSKNNYRDFSLDTKGAGTVHDSNYKLMQGYSDIH